jgi:hypothetical protein
MKQNLIVVRAGDKSLHPQWLDTNRNWDIAVSYYGSFAERYKDQYDELHVYKGSKWQGLNDFIIKYESYILNYKYVWFPDDDLLSDFSTINKFFNLCSLLDLTIAQPALTEYSYYYWEITLRKPNLAARITDFVEIMAPCFKVASFEKFKSTFSENTSGHGLEWLWKKIAIENDIFKFGIVDAAPVFHTRKVGSAGHGGSLGPPQKEMSDLLTKYKIQATQPVNLRTLIFRE